MGERLRGVEQVGRPAAPTPIPASEAEPIALRKAAPEVLSRAEEWLYYENELPPETIKRLVRDLAATLRAEMKGWASARGDAVDHSLRADKLETIVRDLAASDVMERAQWLVDSTVGERMDAGIAAEDIITDLLVILSPATAWVEANPT